MRILVRLCLVLAAYAAFIPAGSATGAESRRAYPADVLAEGHGSYNERVLFTVGWGKGPNQVGIRNSEEGRLFGPGLIYAFRGLIIIPDAGNKRLMAFDENGKPAWQIEGLPSPIDRVFRSEDEDLYLSYEWSLYRVNIPARKIEKVNYKIPEWLQTASMRENNRVFPVAVHFGRGGNLLLELHGSEDTYTIEYDRDGQYIRHYDVSRCVDPAELGLRGIYSERAVGETYEVVISYYDFQDVSRSGTETVLKLPGAHATIYGSPMMDGSWCLYLFALSDDGLAVRKFDEKGKLIATLGGKYLVPSRVESNDGGDMPVSVADSGDVYILATDPAKGATVVKYEFSQAQSAQAGMSSPRKERR